MRHGKGERTVEGCSYLKQPLLKSRHLTLALSDKNIHAQRPEQLKNICPWFFPSLSFSLTCSSPPPPPHTHTHICTLTPMSRISTHGVDKTQTGVVNTGGKHIKCHHLHDLWLLMSQTPFVLSMYNRTYMVNIYHWHTWPCISLTHCQHLKPISHLTYTGFTTLLSHTEMAVSLQTCKISASEQATEATEDKRITRRH